MPKCSATPYNATVVADARSTLISLAIASEAGLSLEDLLARGGKSAKTSTRKPVAPRYRNPDNQQETWTGRGKQPRWLVAELESGAKLQDFLI